MARVYHLLIFIPELRKMKDKRFNSLILYEKETNRLSVL